MGKIQDGAYLRSSQYRDDSNLKKRSGLHELYSTNPNGWFAWMAAQFEFDADSQILEVGCGPAGLWLSQGAGLPPTWQVTLSDFSAGMISKAQSALAGQVRAYRFAVSDAQSLPFPDASFDVLIANHMLYHVPDRPRALAEFRRVLRPGGHLIAATNGQNHMPEIPAWIERARAEEDDPFEAWGWTAFTAFGLENGAQQLAPFFGQVVMHRYPDGLRVTEVEPLLAYVDSTIRFGGQTSPLFERLRALWGAEIREKGAVHISKDSGIFIARRD